MPTTQALALTCLRHGSAPRSGRASSQSGRAPCPSGSLKKTHINPKKMRYRRQFEEHTGPRKRTFTPANLEHVRPGGHRRVDEMQAVADALSLLANIVMAWNTAQMQTVLDSWANRRQIVPPELIGRIAPTRLEGINLRGVFRFPIERYAD